MLKITEEKIELIGAKYLKVSGQVRSICTKWLQQILQEVEEIVLDNENLPEYISVSYDGGNHPEYDSNVFSSVDRVYLSSNGDVLLDTEDASKYSISNITTEELYELCDFIIKYKKELYIE